MSPTLSSKRQFRSADIWDAEPATLPKAPERRETVPEEPKSPAPHRAPPSMPSPTTVPKTPPQVDPCKVFPTCGLEIPE